MLLWTLPSSRPYQARFFEDEIRPHLKHKKRGLLGMASECPWLLAAL